MPKTVMSTARYVLTHNWSPVQFSVVWTPLRDRDLPLPLSAVSFSFQFSLKHNSPTYVRRWWAPFAFFFFFLSSSLLPVATRSSRKRNAGEHKPPYASWSPTTGCWPLTSTHFIYGSLMRWGGRERMECVSYGQDILSAIGLTFCPAARPSCAVCLIISSRGSECTVNPSSENTWCSSLKAIRSSGGAPDANPHVYTPKFSPKFSGQNFKKWSLIQ
jgi:hypothetical protein